MSNSIMKRLPHILIVDDVDAVIKLAEIVLSEGGRYRTSSARSGEEALNLVQVDQPDLILLDVKMSGLGGYETCRRLKQDPRYQNIPVIFLTVMDAIEDIVEGFEAGGADYVNKPFVPAVLLARIELHLKLYFLQQRERETNRYLQSILTSMDQGLVVLSASGVIQQCNPKLEQLSGRSEAELLGVPFEALFSEPLKTESEEQQERLLQHQNGEQIPVSVLDAPLDVHMDGEKSSVVLIHDIRALLTAERQRQAGEAKDNFLAAMSHELRTPLSAIIGNSQLLMGRVRDGEDRQLLKSIENAGRNQLELIKSVLLVSRIDSGSVHVSEAAYDLSALVKEIKQLFQPRFLQAGVAFTVVERELPTYQLLGDVELIKQVLFNIVDNALKFTEQGAVTLHVYHAEERIHFDIEDSGVGISPLQLESAFSRFQQGDSSHTRRFGGCGLGLYIANSLMELMGGEIEVESEVGRGSRFSLSLPCRLSEQPAYDRNLQETAPSTDHSSATRFNGRVLVAEDTPEMWILLQKILQEMGLEVYVVKNGLEAFQQALETPYDLILMDMQMPVMDGIEATSKLRQARYVQPVVAVSANATPSHQAQFQQAGCDQFLAKPIDRNALLQVLRCYLQPSTGEPAAEPESDDLLDDELRQLFMERLKSMVPTLDLALRYQQWDDIRLIAHNLRGVGSSFGHPELTELGSSVCDAIDTEQRTLTELSQKLLLEIERLLPDKR